MGQLFGANKHNRSSCILNAIRNEQNSLHNSQLNNLTFRSILNKRNRANKIFHFYQLYEI